MRPVAKLPWNLESNCNCKPVSYTAGKALRSAGMKACSHTEGQLESPWQCLLMAALRCCKVVISVVQMTMLKAADSCACLHLSIYYVHKWEIHLRSWIPFLKRRRKDTAYHRFIAKVSGTHHSLIASPRLPTVAASPATQSSPSQTRCCSNTHVYNYCSGPAMGLEKHKPGKKTNT
jgi:hypothetical protein